MCCFEIWVELKKSSKASNEESYIPLLGYHNQKSVFWLSFSHLHCFRRLNGPRLVHLMILFGWLPAGFSWSADATNKAALRRLRPYLELKEYPTSSPSFSSWDIQQIMIITVYMSVKPLLFIEMIIYDPTNQTWESKSFHSAFLNFWRRSLRFWTSTR